MIARKEWVDGGEEGPVEGEDWHNTDEDAVDFSEPPVQTGTDNPTRAAVEQMLEKDKE